MEATDGQGGAFLLGGSGGTDGCDTVDAQFYDVRRGRAVIEAWVYGKRQYAIAPGLPFESSDLDACAASGFVTGVAFGPAGRVAWVVSQALGVSDPQGPERFLDAVFTIGPSSKQNIVLIGSGNKITDLDSSGDGFTWLIDGVAARYE